MSCRTIVWVAPVFRPEHRAALDWLNLRTDENTRFFGVEIAVVRIDDSVPAPMFKLVVQPNDWEKTVRAATRSGEGVSEREALFHRFWSSWQSVLSAEKPGWSRSVVAPKGAWFSMTAKVNGAVYYLGFTKAGLVSQQWFEDRDVTVNESRFATLVPKQALMEAAYGGPLDFEVMPGRKSTRIGEVLSGAAIAQEDDWKHYLVWILDRQTRLRARPGMFSGLAR